MTLFLLGAVTFILLHTFVSRKDFFHPTRIYILLYTLLFAVYFLRLSRVQDTWSSTTAMLFWGAVVSFVGGGLLLTFFVKNVLPGGARNTELGRVSLKLIEREKEVNWDWFIRTILVVFLLFVVSYVYSYVRYGIIPMTSANPNKDRFLYLTGNMLIGFAGGSGPLVMMLCAEVLFVKTTTRKQKTSALVMMGIAFGLYFTLVTRMPLVRSCIYIAVLYHYCRRQISFKMISFFAMLAILFFMFGAIIRVDITGFSELASAIRINLPGKFIVFANPYAYAVNNIWNMDYGFHKFIDGLHEYNVSYGFEMLRGLFYFMRIEAILQYGYNFDSLYNESIVKVTGLNTVLYIWHFYKDFGIAGVFIVSLLFATLVHVFYYNTLIVPSHYRVAIYGLIVSMIVFSFMVPLWSFWNIYYELAILTIAHRPIKLI